MAKTIVTGTIVGERIITEDSDEAREFYNQSRYGAIVNNKVELSLLEALYLMEKERLEIKTENGKKVNSEQFIKKAKKTDPNFWIRYCVFKDIRNRGYIIKTALKFGADFRVYDRGIKPGEDHAKWVVFPVHEAYALTWHDFAAKNRVAHSTKKRLLLAVVDEEGDISYWESRWIRP
ncbi:tRNA-intron lyase [Candidatus Woesearchaeota archaeon]|nr:tRNA-intron lyase [Candidatus Woesearchaeota archaeon]